MSGSRSGGVAGDRKVRDAVRGRPALPRCAQSGSVLLRRHDDLWGVPRGTGGRSVFPGRFVLKARSAAPCAGAGRGHRWWADARTASPRVQGRVSGRGESLITEGAQGCGGRGGPSCGPPRGWLARRRSGRPPAGSRRDRERARAGGLGLSLVAQISSTYGSELFGGGRKVVRAQVNYTREEAPSAPA